MKSDKLEHASWDDLLACDDQRRNAALAALWAAWGRAMYNLALRLLGNEAEASDAVQEALRRLLQSLRRIRPECLPQTYAMRIVHHVCLEWLRKRRAPDGLETVELMADAREDARPADAIVSDMERREMVRQALGRLPEWAKIVLTLKFIDGLDNQEAADVLKVRKNTFEVRLHRAVRILGDMLEQKGL